MAIRYRSLGVQEGAPFESMTFPLMRGKLAKVSRNGPFVAMGAFAGQRPIGLALAEINPKGVAEILSLFVLFDQRMRGVGTSLLRLLERDVKKLGVTRLKTVWNEGGASAEAFSAVLAKLGFSAPHKRLLTLRADMRTVFGEDLEKDYLPYSEGTRLPRGYEISMWRDLNAEESDFIRTRQGRPEWYEARANPFREESLIEPLNSLVLRKGGVVGWLVTHRPGPDTIRYTDVFIRKDLEKTGGVAIAMVVYAFFLQKRLGPPLLTMAVEASNRALVRMYERRMAYAAKVTWSLGAEKSLQVDAAGI